MSKKIWRPFKTWGIVLIGFTVSTVMAYVVAVL